MSNINNEQRNAFAKIVYDNGRAHEFYEKYGQSSVAKNRSKAEAVLAKILSIEEKLDTIQEKYQKEKNELDRQFTKEQDLTKKPIKALEKELDTLGYRRGYTGYGNDRETTIEEDTSRTSAEYEMFKKKTIAAIWGASTLEEGNKAIQNYLNLVK